MNHFQRKGYPNAMMKNIDNRTLVYLIFALPGIVSLFMPYDVTLLRYDVFSLVIVSLVVFVFIYVISKKILSKAASSLKMIFKLISVFFVINGVLFVLSGIIYRMNFSLGILALAYGAGMLFAIYRLSASSST